MSTYVPPPPPPPRNNGWAKWILGGCGGCLILVILFFVWIMRMVGPAIGDSMKLAFEMQQTLESINRYKADTGNYPDKLEDLVPKYVQSEQQLKLSTKPEGPKFTYFKPTKDSKPDDVILQYDLAVKTGDQIVTVPVQFQIDGRSRQGQAVKSPNQGTTGSDANQGTPGSDANAPPPPKSKHK